MDNPFGLESYNSDQEKIGQQASLAQFRRIIQVCDRFEDAWKQGLSPSLFEYTKSLGSIDRKALLSELAILDLQYRWKSASRLTDHSTVAALSTSELVSSGAYFPVRPCLEDYVVAFSDLGPLDSLPLVMIQEEFRVRHVWGDCPSISVYSDRFPGRHELKEALSGIEQELVTHRFSTISTLLSLRIRCPNCANIVDGITANPREVFCYHCKKPFRVIEDNFRSVSHKEGRLVGHFELTKRLGMGGFGEVWQAHDTQLNRTVAMKFPRRGQVSELDVEHFLREARTAAQLTHPHIVAVHEVGCIDDSIYIVSDFIDGESLSAWSTKRQLTTQDAVVLCMKIANAVHYAHEHGVIHRDLKPQNILIDRAEQPFITDFGLAKREAGEVTMTIDGQILGTPAYMSPEQAKGDAHRSDRRSDVYSLGVMLYELLTGERPFRGSVQMLIQQVVHDEPLSPRRLSGHVPRDLETICLKCLQKEPELRYQTALDFANDLDCHLSGRPIAARPAGVAERTWRWISRNPAYAGLISAVLAVGLVGLATTSWQLRNALMAEESRLLAEVNSLATAESESIPEKIALFDTGNLDVVRALQKLAKDRHQHVRLRAKTAMLLADPTLVPEVYKALLSVGPKEFLAIRRVLESSKATGIHQIQEAIKSDRTVTLALVNPNTPDDQRLHAAALARNDEEFNRQADNIARILLQHSVSSPELLPYYLEMFQASSSSLTDALTRAFSDHSISEQQRTSSAVFLAEYLKNDTKAVASLVIKSKPQQFMPLAKTIAKLPVAEVRTLLSRYVQDKLRINSRDSFLQNMDLELTAGSEVFGDEDAAQLANAAIAMLHAGYSQLAFKLLGLQIDPSIQSHLIDRFGKLGVPPNILVEQLHKETDTRIQTALLLALSEYSSNSLLQSFPEFITSISSLYEAASDSGVRSSARYLLQKLGEDDRLHRLDEELSKGGLHSKRNWHLNSELHTMVELTLSGGAGNSPPGATYRFAISATEVTIDQLSAHSEPWLKHRWTYDPNSRGGDCPAIMVTWSEAASYCNWLSKNDGIPRQEWCYERVDTDDNDRPLLLAKQGATKLLGYRLPTTNEWEFACSGGAQTARFFGEEPGLLSKYAWWGLSTEDGQVRPVATKMPNQFGLFDMYGNALEWCHNAPNRNPGQPAIRLLRGLGAGDLEADRTRPKPPGDAALHSNSNVAGGIGFRVAKTLE